MVMATYTPSTPIDHIGHGHKPPAPSAAGGGDDGRGGGDVPNYGARLRRARLGLICAIATVCMVFISLTSAYIVRQGLPTFDDASRTAMCATGAACDLPWVLLAINTAVLAGQQCDHGRRAAEGGAAGGAGSGEVDPGSLAGRMKKSFPGWGLRCCWDWISGGAMDGVGRAAGAGIFCETRIPTVRLFFC